MERRWSHANYWLETLSKAYEFRPAKISIGTEHAKGVRLWPPSTHTPKGRPRTKPMKKQLGKRAITEFANRTHSIDEIGLLPSSNSQSRRCGLCGSTEHNRRSCRGATAGDTFERLISKRMKITHFSLPTPPPDDTLSLLHSDDEQSMQVPHEYYGKGVLKLFETSPGSGTKRYYSGQVGHRWREGGQTRYRIIYDDQDTGYFPP